MSTTEKYNITVIGAPGVGKSALTLRLLYQEFVDDYEPTKLDSYQTTMTVNNNPVEVQITDTAGQEDYASVRDTFLRNGEGFLCVFSITDTESFNHVQELFNQVKVAKSLSHPQLPFLIVGNKSDLESTRQIQKEDAEKMAESLGVKYMETSAKTNSNVDEAFQQIIQMEMEARAPLTEENNANKKKKKSSGFKKFLCGLA